MPLDPDLNELTTASPTIASYPAKDISTGTGIENFYGIVSETGAGFVYSLTANSNLWSVLTSTIITGGGATEYTYNFDLSPFNLPRYAQGIAEFNAAMGVNQNGIVSLKVQLKHVRVAAETNLSAEHTTQTYTFATTDSEMLFLRIQITTPKQVAIGDFLRCTVKLVQGNAGGSAVVSFGHDPANQPGGLIIPATKNTTIMRLNMPFRIDL